MTDTDEKPKGPALHALVDLEALAQELWALNDLDRASEQASLARRLVVHLAGMREITEKARMLAPHNLVLINNALGDAARTARKLAILAGLGLRV